MCVGRREENKGCDKVPLSVSAFHISNFRWKESKSVLEKMEVDFGDTFWRLGMLKAHGASGVSLCVKQERERESTVTHVFCLHLYVDSLYSHKA